VGTGAEEENYERWWEEKAAHWLPPPHHNIPLAQVPPPTPHSAGNPMVLYIYSFTAHADIWTDGTYIDWRFKSCCTYPKGAVKKMGRKGKTVFYSDI